MEIFIALLLILLLVTAALVVACLAIYNRKRRQPTRRRVVNETQPTEIAERHIAPQEPQPSGVEEAELTVAEETLLIPVAETQPTGIHEAHLPAMPKTQPPTVEETQSTKVQEAQLIAEAASWSTVPEAQKTIPAETQPTITMEIETSGAGEAQATAIEEAQATVAEEREPRETGRFPQQETAKVQPEGALEEKKGQREPIKRGGKPRGPTKGLEKERAQRIQPRRLNPEIVCRKRERQWVLAVEVPEELLGKPGLEVLQNGSPLPRDDSEETCWRLEQVAGEVIVRWNEAEVAQKITVGLGQEGYLVFKLSGQDLSQGRRVKSPSSGSYLVVAPNDWPRDEALSGRPQVNPEPTSLTGYQAHFFELEKGGEQKIAFQLPKGQSQVIKAKAPRFDLVGKRIEDASENIGPLFGGKPPRIRVLDAQVWKNIGTIVVGEEGSGRGRWRTAFSPDPGQMEQDLPYEVAARKGGWYFLRFYDSDDDLIESIDFRFLSVLTEIKLPQLHHLPTGDGHKPVCIEFVHEADCAVQPLSNLAKIKVEPQDGKTILGVPPDPACDESHWLIGPKLGPRVEVTINVERIWWGVGGEGSPPSDWQDRPVVLAREDFKATSNRVLWLRLPKLRWVDRVLVGFQRSKARRYDVKVTEKTVAIPLREYSDYAEVGDQTQQQNLRLWLNRDHQDFEGVLAVVPAAQKAEPVVPPLTQSWVGFGRKKTAIAKAVMQYGVGGIEINGQPLDEYFRRTPRKAKQFLGRLVALGEVREALSQLEVKITVEGSSPTTTRQPKAVAHALARTLMDYDPQLRRLVRQAGFGGVKVNIAKANRRHKR